MLALSVVCFASLVFLLVSLCEYAANRSQPACLPSLKPLLNLILYRSVYPKSYYGSAESDAQTIHEIAEAAKRRRQQERRDASIPSAYLFDSMRSAMDPHPFEQLSEVEIGSVHGDIEMERYGESSKGSHPDQT